jgi:Flp pilus assembly protein TadD
VLEGNLVAAEATFRRLCEELDRAAAYSHLASRAGDLAEVLYVRGELDEAAVWVGVAKTHTSVDDLDACLLWMPVEAKLAARQGDLEGATARLSEAVALAETADGLNRRAFIQLDLHEVCRIARRRDAATSALTSAIELFETKGNVVGVERARSLRDDLVLA